MSASLAAVIATILMLAVTLFQVALALGAPFGAMTMGGRARRVGGVLTPPYRVAAALSAVQVSNGEPASADSGSGMISPRGATTEQVGDAATRAANSVAAR